MHFVNKCTYLGSAEHGSGLLLPDLVLLVGLADSGSVGRRTAGAAVVVVIAVVVAVVVVNVLTVKVVVGSESCKMRSFSNTCTNFQDQG